MSTLKSNNTPRVTGAHSSVQDSGSGSKVVGRLLGLVLEVPPAAYIALTGTVPLWARIWLCVWLSLWLLVTVVGAVKAQVSEAGR